MTEVIKVSYSISLAEIHASLDPFELVQESLTQAGFDLTKIYSMYYDRVLDGYVYQQTLKGGK